MKHISASHLFLKEQKPTFKTVEHVTVHGEMVHSLKLFYRGEHQKKLGKTLGQTRENPSIFQHQKTRENPNGYQLFFVFFCNGLIHQLPVL